MTNKFYENVLMLAGAFSDDMDDYTKALAEQLVERAQLTPPEFNTIIYRCGKFYEVLVSVRGMHWVMDKNTVDIPRRVPVFRVSRTEVRIFKYFVNIKEASYAANSDSTLYAHIFTINQSDEASKSRDIDEATLAIQEFFLVSGRLITKP